MSHHLPSQQKGVFDQIQLYFFFSSFISLDELQTREQWKMQN